MAELTREADFFKSIAPKIQKFVEESATYVSIVKQKGLSGDYATHVDVGVEELIVQHIKEAFPADEILAEEKSSDTKVTDKRIWIIDPICGTRNLGRGIKEYCTNIALAIDQKLVASCVVDHSQSDYYWSIGDGKVFVNDKPLGKAPDDGSILIDVDLDALIGMDREARDRHAKAVSKLLLTETDFNLISLDTSLTFLYVATGRIDGVFNAFNNPWDAAASAFLMQQTGKVMSDINGKPWAINSDGMIAAKDSKLHQKLVDIYLAT